MEREKLLLTVYETCKALGVSRETLRRLTYPRGALRCVRLGRSVRYSRATIEQWIAEHEAAATAGSTA